MYPYLCGWCGKDVLLGQLDYTSFMHNRATYYVHHACMSLYVDSYGMGPCDLCDAAVVLHSGDTSDTDFTTGNHIECEAEYAEHQSQKIHRADPAWVYPEWPGIR